MNTEQMDEIDQHELPGPRKVKKSHRKHKRGGNVTEVVESCTVSNAMCRVETFEIVPTTDDRGLIKLKHISSASDLQSDQSPKSVESMATAYAAPRQTQAHMTSRDRENIAEDQLVDHKSKNVEQDQSMDDMRHNFAEDQSMAYLCQNVVEDQSMSHLVDDVVEDQSIMPVDSNESEDQSAAHLNQRTGQGAYTINKSQSDENESENDCEDIAVQEQTSPYSWESALSSRTEETNTNSKLLMKFKKLPKKDISDDTVVMALDLSLKSDKNKLEESEEIQNSHEVVPKNNAELPPKRYLKKFVCGKEKQFQCDVCGRRVMNAGALRQHMTTHNRERPFACDFCEMTFAKASKLKIHRRIHTGEKPYQCKFCDKRFAQTGNLHEHLRLHTGEQPYECDDCGKKFKWSNSLQRHILTHIAKKAKLKSNEDTNESDLLTSPTTEPCVDHSGDKPYSCGFCGTSYRYSRHLQKHVKTHAEYLIRLCVECKNKLKTSSVRDTNHKEVLAGTDSCEECKKLANNTNLRPYRCTHCGETFSQVVDLQGHVKAESGGKPHTCVYCGRGFTQRFHLQQHERIHTGEKPFSCEYCQKRFARAGGLRTHIRRHTGEKPYMCRECGHAFARSSNLAAHVRTHSLDHETKKKKKKKDSAKKGKESLNSSAVPDQTDDLDGPTLSIQSSPDNLINLPVYPEGTPV